MVSIQPAGAAPSGQDAGRLSITGYSPQAALCPGRRGRSTSVRSIGAAIDRLVGALGDVPAAKLETWANRIRNKGRVESATYEATVERIESAVGGEAEAARLLDDVVASHMELVANRHRVARRAIKLLALPSPAAEPEPESAADEVDRDWLAHLAGYAENANSDKVRDLWGRVLAGEIRRPGSFSLMTLRVLAELDQRMAAWFEEATRFRFKNEFILRPKSMTNEQIIRMTFLEEAGLLQHVAPVGGLAHPLLPGADGYALAIEGDLCLRVRTDGKTSLDVIPITRVGQEIATIFSPVGASAVLERVAAA